MATQKLLLALAIVTTLGSIAKGEEAVRIMFGGPSFTKALEAQRAAAEKSIGTKIEIKAGPVEVSLPALEKGLIDVASFALSPPEAFALAEKRVGFKGKLADYDLSEIPPIVIQFGIHPENPLSALTPQQAADIFSGKIKDWESISGKKSKIVILLAKNYAGTNVSVCRTYAKAEACPTAEYAIDKDGLLKRMQREPGAIAVFPSKEMIQGFTPKYIDSGVRQPVILVTKKNPPSAVMRAAEFIKTMKRAD